MLLDRTPQILEAVPGLGDARTVARRPTMRRPCAAPASRAAACARVQDVRAAAGARAVSGRARCVLRPARPCGAAACGAGPWRRAESRAAAACGRAPCRPIARRRTARQARAASAEAKRGRLGCAPRSMPVAGYSCASSASRPSTGAWRGGLPLRRLARVSRARPRRRTRAGRRRRSSAGRGTRRCRARRRSRQAARRATGACAGRPRSPTDTATARAASRGCVRRGPRAASARPRATPTPQSRLPAGSAGWYIRPRRRGARGPRAA